MTRTPGAAGLPFVALEHVEGGVGRLVTDVELPQSAEADSLTFSPGDVLFGKLRPYLAKVWRADREGACSSEFVVIRPAELRSRYLAYMCLSDAFVNAVDASTYGTKMPRAAPEFIANLTIPIPPSGQQEAIADFLDRETAKVDALIAKKDDLLSKIAELRRTVANDWTRRGVKAHDYHPSGEEWLGDVPAHWQVRKCKWIFRERDDRSGGNADELLTVSHITGVTRRSEKPNVNMFMAEDFGAYKRCRVGDLVINTMWAWMGALGFSPVDGIVSPSYNVYTFRDASVDHRYYDFLFRTPAFAAEVTRLSKGVWSSRLRLYPEAFFEIAVPIPPLAEQSAIVQAVEAQTERFEALVKPTKASLSLLREYRSALISAAVTGQFEIPGTVSVSI